MAEKNLKLETYLDNRQKIDLPSSDLLAEKQKLRRMELTLTNAKLVDVIFEEIQNKPHISAEQLIDVIKTKINVSHPRVLKKFITKIYEMKYMRDRVLSTVTQNRFAFNDHLSIEEALFYSLSKFNINQYKIEIVPHPLVITVKISSNDLPISYGNNDKIAGFFDKERKFHLRNGAEEYHLVAPLIVALENSGQLNGILKHENYHFNDYLISLFFKDLKFFNNKSKSNEIQNMSLKEVEKLFENSWSVSKSVLGKLFRSILTGNSYSHRFLRYFLKKETILPDYIKALNDDMHTDQSIAITLTKFFGTQITQETTDKIKREQSFHDAVNYLLESAKYEILAELYPKAMHGKNHLENVLYNKSYYFLLNLGLSPKSTLFIATLNEYLNIMETNVKFAYEIFDFYERYMPKRATFFRNVLAQWPMSEWKTKLEELGFLDEMQTFVQIQQKYKQKIKEISVISFLTSNKQQEIFEKYTQILKILENSEPTKSQLKFLKEMLMTNFEN